MHADRRKKTLRIVLVTQTALILLSIAKMMDSDSSLLAYALWSHCDSDSESVASTDELWRPPCDVCAAAELMFLFGLFVDGFSRWCLHRFVVELFELASPAINSFIIPDSFCSEFMETLSTPFFSKWLISFKSMLIILDICSVLVCNLLEWKCIENKLVNLYSWFKNLNRAMIGQTQATQWSANRFAGVRRFAKSFVPKKRLISRHKNWPCTQDKVQPNHPHQSRSKLYDQTSGRKDVAKKYSELKIHTIIHTKFSKYDDHPPSSTIFWNNQWNSILRRKIIPPRCCLLQIHSSMRKV